MVLDEEITKRIRDEEKREERRERARLRRIDREVEETNETLEQASESELKAEFEQADQFAPQISSVPEHWSNWSEHHWNIKLLKYCFVEKANEHSANGIPSTEEDLAFVTGDKEHLQSSRPKRWSIVYVTIHLIRAYHLHAC